MSTRTGSSSNQGHKTSGTAVVAFRRGDPMKYADETLGTMTLHLGSADTDEFLGLALTPAAIGEQVTGARGTLIDGVPQPSPALAVGDLYTATGAGVLLTAVSTNIYYGMVRHATTTRLTLWVNSDWPSPPAA